MLHVVVAAVLWYRLQVQIYFRQPTA